MSWSLIHSGECQGRDMAAMLGSSAWSPHCIEQDRGATWSSIFNLSVSLHTRLPRHRAEQTWAGFIIFPKPKFQRRHLKLWNPIGEEYFKSWDRQK